MLRIEEVTYFIEQKLNEIGGIEQPTYKFKLFADFGKAKGASEIIGLVRLIKGDPGYISNLDDIEYQYTCQFIVPSSMSNYNIINIKNIVDKFVAINNGQEIEIGDGTAQLTFSTSTVGDYKQEGGFGDIVPVQFTINIKYSSDTLLSSQKHWFLDDFELPFTSEGVYVDKEGLIRKVSGKNYSKTLITGQTKYYKFTFPFDTKNQLCIQLQRDLLNGDLNKQYKLKYYDGVSFTKGDPFVTTVSIFRNGDANAQILKTSQFNLTFTDVDDGQDGVKYYLGLCDTNFDLNSENTRYFEGAGNKTAQQVQIGYWEDKISKGCQYEQIKAPNLNSIDITNQIYTNTRNYDLYDLVNKNYAVVKVEKNGEPIKYFYYFVTNASIGAQNQVAFDLKLDSIQTYYFNDGIEFGDCLISRAHLNRWIDNGDGTVSFDGTTESKLFEREDISNVAKRLTNRSKVSLYKNIKSIKAAQWLNENVLCWIYIFLDASHEFITTNVNGEDVSKTRFLETKIKSKENTGLISTKLCAACIPVLKDNKSFYCEVGYVGTTRTDTIIVGQSMLEKFLNKNNGASYVYAMKISANPPFYNLADSASWLISDNGDSITLKGIWTSHSSTTYVLGSDFSLGGDTHLKVTDVPSQWGIFYVETQGPSIETQITTSYRYDFSKDEIVNSGKNSLFNPKLLSSDFCSIRIGTENTGFDYDAQKLNTNDISILYTEPLSPDITKTYIRYKGKNGAIYNELSGENFTGDVSSNDTSLVLVTEAYQTMLANNKNYFLQNTINRVGDVANGILGVGMNLATQNYGAAVSSGIGSMTGFISGIINEKLTVDNMKSAPSCIQNAKGNAFFNYMISDMGIIVEEYEILSHEKQLVNDYMDLYGFTFNCIDNIKNYCNIREYHNYIQAELTSISGVAISNNARADIKQRFQNGIRFWNSDNIQYDLENYEKWLES